MKKKKKSPETSIFLNFKTFIAIHYIFILSGTVIYFRDFLIIWYFVRG